MRGGSQLPSELWDPAVLLKGGRGKVPVPV